jgi:chemotaxis protein CheX
MDAILINSFVAAVVKVLKTMAFTETKPGKAYLKTGREATGDVSGVIGMTGKREGSMSISFDESTICTIVSKMFGESITTINEEVADAVGELTNMICGDARRTLEGEGHIIKGAIPTVIAGKDHTIKHISNDPVIAIPFTSDAGKFMMEISLNM